MSRLAYDLPHFVSQSGIRLSDERKPYATVQRARGLHAWPRVSWSPLSMRHVATCAVSAKNANAHRAVRYLGRRVSTHNRAIADVGSRTIARSTSVAKAHWRSSSRSVSAKQEQERKPSASARLRVLERCSNKIAIVDLAAYAVVPPLDSLLSSNECKSRWSLCRFPSLCSAALVNSVY